MASRYVIYAGTLIDGNGGEPAHDVTLTIEGSTITSVSPGFENAAVPGTRLIDLSDKVVLPGLWDCHVHLSLEHPFTEYRTDVEPVPYLTARSYSKALQALNSGFTSLRCVGMGHFVDLNLKKAINRGLLAGPNIFSSGHAIIITGGHGYNGISTWEADGPVGFAQAARAQLKEGADLIKMCISGGLGSPHEAVSDAQATVEEMAAAVDVANRAGKHTTVHGSAPGPIQAAISAGVRCIEHAYELDEETVNLMAKNEVYLCPTLAVTNCGDYLLRNGAPSWQVEKQKIASETHFAGFRMAAEAGISILAGTDLLPTDEVDGTIAGLREIELLVAGGLPPMRAIQAATRTPAEICGVLDRIGTLEPGKRADLIAVGSNPIESIRAIRDVQFVMKDGSVVRDGGSRRYR